MRDTDTKLIWEARRHWNHEGEALHRIQKIQKAVEGVDDLKTLDEIFQMIQDKVSIAATRKTDPDDAALLSGKRQPDPASPRERGIAAQGRRPTSYDSFDEPSFGKDYD